MIRRTLPALALAVAVVGGLLVTATPATAAGRSMPCLPTSGLGSRTETQARAFMNDGKLTLPGFAPVAIGTSGNVNWAMDPYKSQTWRRYFLSLKWLDQYTKWYQLKEADPHDGNPSTDMLARAQAYAADFARDHGIGTGTSLEADAWTAMYTGQRATVFTCLDALAPGNSLIRNGIYESGTWLHAPAHDPGAWNQGVDTYIGLLSAGCAYGSTVWADHAATRLDQLVNQTIASDGTMNEQAPGYGVYLYGRWGIASDHLKACGRTVPSNLAARQSALLSFLAWTSEPNGNVAQLGDSFRSTISPTMAGVPGTAAEWTGSRGTAGTAPTTAFRTFSTGWGFGRDTWNPYTSSAWYALRWGPGRQYHGHDDHQSVLLDAFGKQILIDSGHYGYTVGAYRDYLTGPTGHNVMTMPGVAFSKLAATTLTRTGGTGSWRWYEMTDKAYANRTRTRSVLVDVGPNPLVVAFDRASRASAGAFQQLWHLPPGSKVSIASRSRAVATSLDGQTQTTLLQFPLPGQVLAPGATTVVSGRTAPYQGWVSYANGTKSAAPTVVMSRSGTSVAMVSMVLATPVGKAVSASMKLNSDGWYHLTVVVDGVSRLVRISSGGALSR